MCNIIIIKAFASIGLLKNENIKSVGIKIGKQHLISMQKNKNRNVLLLAIYYT